MTSGRSGRIAEWVAAVVALLFLLGSAGVAYSDLNSKILSNQLITDKNTEEIEELDVYDVHLTEKLDELKGDAIRTEAEMGSLQRATEKLEFTMSEILKEMRRMNDNLIEMGVKGNANG
jgi:chromosome segregation ATPase